MMTAVERAHLAALAGFDHMTTPAPRARSAPDGRPSRATRWPRAWSRRRRRSPEPFGSTPSSPNDGRRRRRTITPEAIGDRCAELGVDILVPGDPGWPAQLLDDPRRPAVLFAQGDPGVLLVVASGSSGPATPRVGARRPPPDSATSWRPPASVSSRVWPSASTARHIAVRSPRRRPRRRRSSRTVTAIRIPAVIERCGSRWPRPGSCLSEWPPGTAPDPVSVPAAQSDPRGTVRARRRGREPQSAAGA